MGRPGLMKHPKFKRLVHLLHEPEPHVRGYLECLWDTCYECGDPVIGDATDVILACGCNAKHAKHAKLVDALLHAGGDSRKGFIEKNDDGEYQVHDLYDHAPDYVQRRMEREAARSSKGLTISEVRRNAALVRWQRKNASDMQVDTFADCQDANGATPAPAPAPALKKKEEDAATPDQTPVVMKFPVVGSDNTEWDLHQSFIDDCRQSYPSLDVL